MKGIAAYRGARLQRIMAAAAALPRTSSRPAARTAQLRAKHRFAPAHGTPVWQSANNGADGFPAYLPAILPSPHSVMALNINSRVRIAQHTTVL